MLKLLLSTSLILLFASQSYAIEPDKLAHAKVGAGIGFTLATLGQIGDLERDERFWMSTGFACGIGAAKEWTDSMSESHTAEFADFAYTCGSGIIGWAASEVLGEGVQLIIGKDNVAVAVTF